MAHYLREIDHELRQLVIEHEGNQRLIAEALNLSVAAVSRRLTSERHGAWWRSYKKRRKKRRAAARQRRWRENAAARARAAYVEES
jgi:predicted transcriptional regulator